MQSHALRLWEIYKYPAHAALRIDKKIFCFHTTVLYSYLHTAI